ncbi:hypothetical protein [Runella sp. SP2]|uniref:hypothetical protein n=1 Tax=Runella sp. SP2 TaxID=2268026 RepID=UPI0013DD8ACF|nr:hypothetical protein [Runella sp. SP2]
MNKLTPSKSILWLIAILLLLFLGLLFIWLWYDAKIQEINRQTRQLQSSYQQYPTQFFNLFTK